MSQSAANTTSSSTSRHGLTLMDMPNEILRNITSHLKHDRYNSVLASKKLYEIGSPLLYKLQYSQSRNEAEFNYFHHKQLDDIEDNYQPIYLFLRDLIRNPEIAGKVRKITLRAEEPDGELEEAWLNVKDDIFDDQDWEELKSFSKQVLDESEQEATISGLKKGEWQSAAVLVLAHLWNLEEIDITENRDVPPCLEQYLHAAGRCQHGQNDTMDLYSALPRLSKVYTEFSDTEYGRDTRDMDLWMGLKSLRVLEGNMWDAGGYYDEDDNDSDFVDGDRNKVVNKDRRENNDSDEDGDPKSFQEVEQLPPNTNPSSITKLSLYSSAIGAHEMESILRLCPHLKSLQYDYNGPIVNDACAPFQPPRLRRAFLMVKDTLEHLTLDDMTDNAMDELFADYPLGTLKDFTKLKSLEMSQKLLTGNSKSESLEDESRSTNDEVKYPATMSLTDALPHTIETLDFGRYEGEDIRHLLDLAQNLPLFPALRVVKLEHENPGDVFVGDEVILMNSLFRAAGVSFEVRSGWPREFFQIGSQGSDDGVDSV